MECDLSGSLEGPLLYVDLRKFHNIVNRLH